MYENMHHIRFLIICRIPKLKVHVLAVHAVFPFSYPQQAMLQDVKVFAGVCLLVWNGYEVDFFGFSDSEAGLM